MIDNNTIKFGYGTLLVQANTETQEVIIKHINTEKPIGDIENNEEVLQEIKFKFKLNIKLFIDKLKKMKPSNMIVEYENYLFDFTSKNYKSINIVIDAFEKTYKYGVYNLFNELYKNNYRNISKKDLNSIKYGFINQIDKGRYEILTIEGLKKLAKNNYLKYEDEYITPEEIEEVFNYIGFKLELKGN